MFGVLIDYWGVCSDTDYFLECLAALFSFNVVHVDLVNEWNTKEDTVLMHCRYYGIPKSTSQAKAMPNQAYSYP